MQEFLISAGSRKMISIYYICSNGQVARRLFSPSICCLHFRILDYLGDLTASVCYGSEEVRELKRGSPRYLAKFEQLPLSTEFSIHLTIESLSTLVLDQCVEDIPVSRRQGKEDKEVEAEQLGRVRDMKDGPILPLVRL